MQLGHYPSGPQAHDAQLGSIFEVVVLFSLPIAVATRALNWRLMHHYSPCPLTDRTWMRHGGIIAVSLAQTAPLRRISVHLFLRRFHNTSPRIWIISVYEESILISAEIHASCFSGRIRLRLGHCGDNCGNVQFCTKKLLA